MIIGNWTTGNFLWSHKHILISFLALTVRGRPYLSVPMESLPAYTRLRTTMQRFYCLGLTFTGNKRVLCGTFMPGIYMYSYFFHGGLLPALITGLLGAHKTFHTLEDEISPSLFLVTCNGKSFHDVTPMKSKASTEQQSLCECTLKATNGNKLNGSHNGVLRPISD